MNDTNMTPRACTNGGSTPLPFGKQWVGHTGRRQQFRELKRAWRAFEKECAASPELASARETLLDAVVDIVSPEDEQTACWLAVQASRVRAAATGKRFADILNSAIDEMLSAPTVSKTWTDAPAT